MKKYQIGDIIDKYKIVRVIGKGSFGTVYEAVRNEGKHSYRAAVKVISISRDDEEYDDSMLDGLTEDDLSEYYSGLVDELIEECALMEDMKGDSHIVSYEDHHVESDPKNAEWTIIIRMELLASFQKGYKILNEPMNEKDVIKLGIDICRALETCEKKNNVIHRDIKPENIFVSKTGNYKLGDFGIAKVLGEREKTASKKGTEPYMAPEVFKGQPYDLTVDIYSLGLVLYRLMNRNRAPFLPPFPEKIKHTDNKEALLKRINGGKDFNPPQDASINFAEVILKACAYDPHDRYQHAQDMRRDLEKIFGAEVETDYPEKIWDVMFEDDSKEDNISSDISSKDIDSGIWAGGQSVIPIPSSLQSDGDGVDGGGTVGGNFGQVSLKEIEARRKAEAEEEARRREEEARRKAEEEAKRKAEEEARRREEEERRRAEEEARRREEEERRRAEEEAKRKAEEEARRREEERRRAEEEAKRKAEEEERRRAEEEARRREEEERRKAEEEARRREEEERRRAEEEARRREEEARRREEEERRRAEEEAKRKAEEEERRRAEEEARRREEEERRRAEEEARRKAEEEAKRKAEEEAKKREEEEHRKAEEARKNEAEEKENEKAKKEIKLKSGTSSSFDDMQDFTDDMAPHVISEKDKTDNKNDGTSNKLKEHSDKTVPQTKKTSEIKTTYTNTGNGRIIKIVGGITAALLCIGVLVLVLVNQKIKLPDMVGMTQAEAEEFANQKGILLTVQEAYSKDYATGIIMFQGTAAGEKVEKNTELIITVSKGMIDVMPEFNSDYIASDVSSEFEELGFVVNNVEVYSTIEAGHIAGYEPAVGTALDSGATVTFYVSKGAAAMPDVMGVQQADACATLDSVNVTYDIVETNSTDYETGVVISQDIAEGTEVGYGTTVNLEVCAGPVMLTVPSVIGMSEDEAKQALIAAGFAEEGITVTHEYDGSVAAGLVKAQSPDADSSVQEESAISIVISDGAQPVTRSTNSSSGGSSSSDDWHWEQF